MYGNEVTTDKQFCLNCLFWIANPQSQDEPMERRYGFCRRYPPVVFGVRFQNATTRGTMWCGEWEEEEEDE